MTCPQQTSPQPLHREDSAPQEVPHKQKYHNLSVSVRDRSGCCQRGRPTTGNTRTHSPCYLFNWFVGFFQKKREGQHGRRMTGLSYTLNGLSLPPRLLCCVFVSCLWRGSFVSVFGGKRLERCQSTSRHGTCRCYAQSSR